MSKVLGITGIVLLAFALVDYLLASWFDIDITGTSWSTIIAGGIGAVLAYTAIQMESEKQKNKKEAE